MAEFLTTHGTASSIETIMRNAKKQIFLVSPFLQISKTFYDRLLDASDYGIDIKIIYGKSQLKLDEWNSLAEIPRLELYYLDNLHAKCYFNENTMVITSMNMYEYSEKNNKEMGVLVDFNNDHELYENAKREVISIIKLAERINLNKSGKYLEKNIVRDNHANSEVGEKSVNPNDLNNDLKNLDIYLCNRFIDSKINSAKDYLFSRNLVPVFHVFIKTKDITLKLPMKNPSNEVINNINKNLSCLTEYEIKMNSPKDEYPYYTWDITNFQSLTGYGTFVTELRKITF